MNYNYPTSDEIEPEQAKYLFDNCAILIVEQLPIGSEFGIDLFVYQIGEKFKGVKLIPPGIHFVYASGNITIRKNNSNNLTDKHQTSSDHNSLSTSTGPRCGFYHNFKSKELLVKRWSIREEEFDINYSLSEDEYQRYYCNLKNLDSFLGPYRYSTYETYLNLTYRLTPEIIESLEPKIKLIRSIPYLISQEEDTDSDKMTSKRTKRFIGQLDRLAEENLLSNMKPDKNTIINFTNIPNNPINAEKLISREIITQYNLDTTEKLELSFGPYKQRLLAELQFSFLTFILGHVYDCFEQWKKLLTVICLAEQGLSKYPLIFVESIDILRHQFDQIPEDMFEDIVDSNNLARTMLDTLNQNITELHDCDKNILLLKERFLNLKKYLEKKFNWQFDIEIEEEQPVIVEM